ncbi:ABC-2 transporter permease [Candidatus Contubernalis alkaliaceticus]|uniref:ABC-2 transporter permease n=1 Tax=Candidatus Contubernalis alkaliaceticus TaxID=338645 RepID=UPI001F4C4EA0|nr:ABC-2 transporter permease [Candidatus Contubernalis alkalaceticus]UNC91071.1 ABC-2 transporter permease [Candidatus Contubernalis alkalaceticus]
MIYLILKDILVQKKALLAALAYSFFFLLVLGCQGNPLSIGAYIIGALAINYMFVQNSCAADEKNSSDIVLNSLPITRRDVVVSKYLSSILFIIYNIFIINAAGYFLSTLNIGQITPMTIQIAAIIFPLAVFFTAFFLPIYFKIGYEKSRLYVMFGFLFSIFLPSYLISYIIENPSAAWVITLQTFYENSPAWIMGLMGTAAVFALFLLSIFISIRFYLKRAF